MCFRMSIRQGAALVALAIAGILFAGSSAQAQKWGSVKGQVVWAGGPMPKNGPANVTMDKKVCLANGPILENKLVIDKKSSGIRWVLVWLADPKDANNAKFVPAIHPLLMNPPKTVEIDQPCCTFEPRVMGMLAKQDLVVKNPAKVTHNFYINSIGAGPVSNPLITAGGQFTIKGFVPKYLPTSYSCSIHPWMKGWIGTFAHPYFAVTDAQGNFEIKNAPVGKFQLVVWQEECGFVLQKDSMNKKLRGQVIEIKPKAATDLGKIKLELPKDD